MLPDRAGSAIRQNIRIHDRIAGKYDGRHPEIFNPREQSRLRATLARALEGVQSGGRRALDFGCGSGNLTRHLLDLGCQVVAADVSPKFLELARRQFAGAPLSTLPLNGVDLAELEDGLFDLVATYSVLHHVPDYLKAVAEMARVTRAGGVLVIDHEVNPRYWSQDPIYAEFVERARGPKTWRRYLKLENYVARARLLIDPDYYDEGDIHVHPDDHIEWDRISALLAASGFEILFEQDYLVYRANYPPELYELYRERCTDMRVMAFRKMGPPG
jgi:SAM-dependent methyltransferase